jgi:hypothetical protein
VLGVGIINKRIIGALTAIVVICAVVIYLSMQRLPSGPEGPSGGAEKVTVEMPLARVKAAVASRDGVPQENVEVYFCVPAETVENKKFAAGVVVNTQKSIVFIYDNSTNTITSVENEYTAASDELQAMSVISLKGITSPFAQDYLKHFNANKIVPFGIVKSGGAYTFDYYDGYDAYPMDRWGRGKAVLENGQVSFISHEWME